MAEFAALHRAPPQKAPAPAAAKRKVQESGAARRPPGIQIVQLRAAGRAVPAQEPRAVAKSGGLPARLRAGLEALSGLCMGDVRVHRNSPEPAKLGALAYAKGTEIHLGPGQERHLAHEAWHVVQQKQGRVQATTQLKGIAVNEDASLEAEADRMAAKVAQVRDGPGARPIVASPSKAVLQGKIASHETEMPDFSEVTKQYIAAPEPYIMRGDSKPQDEVIHLVDARKKYLLAEIHNSGKWERDALPWGIDKMIEKERIIPHEADDTGRVFDQPVVAANQPLESAHEHLLAIVIWAHTRLNDLCSERVKKSWKRKKAAVKAAISETLDLFATILNAYAKYKDFNAIYVRNSISGSEALTRIHEFGLAFKDIYKPGSRSVSNWLRSLDSKLDDPESIEDSKKPLFSVEKHLEEIDKERAFLPTMGAGLATLIAGLSGRDTKRITKALAKDSDKFSQEDVVVDPVRERTMASNITAATPPLLVQVGWVHAARLHRTLKPATVLVSKTTPFEDMTRRTAKKTRKRKK